MANHALLVYVVIFSLPTAGRISSTVACWDVSSVTELLEHNADLFELITFGESEEKAKIKNRCIC